MVDPEEVVEFAGPGEPARPPGVSPFPECSPVIDRVPPELPRLAEDIGRHPGDHGRAEVFVEFEDPGVRPDVDALVGDVDRDVADDLDAPLRAVAPEGRPLPGGDVLEELLLSYLVVEQLAHLFERPRLPCPDLLRPPGPRLPAEVVLERDEERVVVEPPSRPVAERLEPAIRPGIAKPFVGNRKQPFPVPRGRLVCRPPVRKTGHRLQFALPEVALPDEHLRADEEGICGERRRARVGGMGVRALCRVERQDLPVVLPSPLKRLDEPVCRRAEVPDAVRRRQGRDMQEYAASPCLNHTSSPENSLF